MANKRQLRVIARNLVAKLALLNDFDTADSLNERDKKLLEGHIKSVAYSIVRKCYRSDKWKAEDIATDIIKNVK